MTEQLALLESRGLFVDNEQAALDYLTRIGYYRLSGYWYPLREINKEASLQQKCPIRTDRFIAGSHFENVVKLYVFDKKLRLLALDALERIEMAIRVDVAYLLGQKDPCAHENPACLHGNFAKKEKIEGPNKGKTEHQIWLNKYHTMLHRAKHEPFIEHHKDKYNGRLPVWVAIEVWDFGLLSYLFNGMQHADKNKISEKYALHNGKILAQWLRSLNFIRNVSAHHGRLWNINVLERTPIPKNWPMLDNAKPFLYFAMMAQLLAVICPNSTWTTRLIGLLNEYSDSKNGTLILDGFGAFHGWEKWLSGNKK